MTTELERSKCTSNTVDSQNIHIVDVTEMAEAAGDGRDQLLDALLRLMNSDAGIAAATDDDLLYAINDDAADPIVREQAAAVLQARAAIAASTKEAS